MKTEAEFDSHKFNFNVNFTDKIEFCSFVAKILA